MILRVSSTKIDGLLTKDLDFYVTEQTLGWKRRGLIRDTTSNSFHSFPNLGKFTDSRALEKSMLGTFKKRPCDNTNSMCKLPSQSDSVRELRPMN